MNGAGSITLGGVTSNYASENLSENRFAKAADRLGISPNPASRIESAPPLAQAHIEAQAS